MATQQSTEPVWHSGRRQRGGQSLLCKRWETLNYTFSCYTTSEGTCTRCPAISLTGTWWVFVVRIQSISLTPAPVLAEMAAFLPVAAHPWSRNASEHWEGSLCISVPLTSEVERETMQSSESEWRMMEISKQRNGIDLLYRKTTNICQDCILYAASANPHCIGLRTGNWFKLRSKLSIL